MAALLARQDGRIHRALHIRHNPVLKPTEYFKRQCWISFEPSEEMMPETMDFIGVDKFMWAADYPHTDSVADPVRLLTKMLAPLSQEDRWKVLGDTAVELYGL